MKKSMIVAMTPSGIIGNGGSLPWPCLPGDLPRFRRLTMGKPCIMGRRTFESLAKPLDGRLNIVVTRNPNWKSSNQAVIIVNTLLEGWIQAEVSGAEEAFAIGGAELYRLALQNCDRLYLTITEREYDGDISISPIDYTNWTLISQETTPDCVHKIYDRNNNVR